MNPHTIVAVALFVIAVNLVAYFVVVERAARAERNLRGDEDRDALAVSLGLLS